MGITCCGQLAFSGKGMRLMERGDMLRELEALYSSLSASDRDRLLQELLTAAPHGGEDYAIEALEAWLLDASVRKTIEGL